MRLLWSPDFCVNGRCSLEVEQGHKALISVIAFCAHHQSLKTRFGLTDAQVFDAMIASSRRKEAARLAVKLRLMELGLMDKEHPGVPWTMDANGDFTILSGTTGAGRADLRTRTDSALLLLAAPLGTSTVTVI